MTSLDTNSGDFESVQNHGKTHSVIRDATVADLDRLTELDLMMFDGAYGESVPDYDETREMFARRLANIGLGGHMLVCEVDGEVNGFGSYFRTDKPWEEFVSWEDSTNNGTLEGVVAPEGRYAYVPNMTVAPKASQVRGMQKIMVNLVGRAIYDGIDYGYFVSRVPELTKWLQSEGYDYRNMTIAELDKLALQYSLLKETSSRGKSEPMDYELRTYTRSGFEQGKLVKAGFSDKESLDYGVTFKAPIPFNRAPRPVRSAVKVGLSLAARSTVLMSKI